MYSIIFAVVIGGWLLFAAKDQSTEWMQVVTNVLAAWFLFAAAFNAWHFSRRED